MLTPETYGLVIPWETINPPTARDVTHALRTYVPETARIIHVETHATPLRTELRIECTIDTAAEQRRIIDEYRNYDPLRAFADIARASRNLPARY